ncbi:MULTISPECIES: hypothetical protein [Deefgea]|uniref:Uncharacterized protein n=1 Tax=Deefgea chitinilytica TaxID=570276 RepID=A0ABS2CA72_9NEIS|nr:MULTISPECIES: hypothetical protein [Deefgea]MBM5570276.1 hypothetical protein [Deefgea chitinilytica]MBM9887505.1 hypothetical protein [Deefgea sp. CFH1-16]
MLKHSLLAIALMLPIGAYAASAKKPETGSPFTKARNQAAGNLSTNIVTMQKMVNLCRNDKNADNIKTSVNNWQTRNKAFLQMHFGYVSALVESVQEKATPEELAKFKENLVKVNTENANTIVKTLVDKDGKDLACEKYFTYLDGGEMDIKPGKPDYATLKEMLDFANKTPSDSKTKK